RDLLSALKPTLLPYPTLFRSEELAIPTFLRLLVSEDVARGVDLHGLRAAAEIGDVESEDRSRELRSQCEVPPSLVLERIQLVDDRGARFRREEVEALERRGGEFGGAEGFGETA